MDAGTGTSLIWGVVMIVVLVSSLDPDEGETIVEVEEAWLVTQQLPYNLQVKGGHYLTDVHRADRERKDRAMADEKRRLDTNATVCKEATREAAHLFGALAVRRPEAFLAELARTLGVRGAALRGAGRAQDAADAFCEGVIRLEPVFLAYPDGSRGLMGGLANEYISAMRALGLAPDEALFAEILPHFQGGQG